MKFPFHFSGSNSRHGQAKGHDKMLQQSLAMASSFYQKVLKQQEQLGNSRSKQLQIAFGTPSDISALAAANMEEPCLVENQNTHR